MRKASKLGIKTGWGEDAGGERIDLGFEKPGGTENEMKHGIIFPINVYPLFENAIRGKKNHSIEKHLDYLGKMFEPFTKVASQNQMLGFRLIEVLRKYQRQMRIIDLLVFRIQNI